MGLREVLDVVIQVAGALAAAHGARLIHRDIKPENIMLRPDGYVKVLDFGLAKAISDQRPGSHQPVVDLEAATLVNLETEPGTMIGTVYYMAPEQARGLDLDARADIFSVGVITYEMLAGRRPFGGDTNLDALISMLENEPPPLASCAPGVPAEIQRIVSKALRKNREERYQTIKDMWIDLKNLREELAFEAKLERSSPPEMSSAEGATTSIQQSVVTDSAKAIRTSSLRKLRRARAIGGALIVVVIGIVGVKMWLASAPTRSDVPSPVAVERALNYWVTVQKYRDGKPYEAPFRLPGEILFEKGYRVRLHFSSPQDVHLYIFNEGPPRNGEAPPLNVLFPSPTANNGLSLVSSGQTVDIPKQSWFRFDQEEGTEKLWLVWSANTIPEFEATKEFANDKDRGVISSPGLDRSVKDFLSKTHLASKPTVEKDDASKETRVKANGDTVVHVIGFGTPLIIEPGFSERRCGKGVVLTGNGGIHTENALLFSGGTTMIHKSVGALSFALCLLSGLAVAQGTTSLQPGQPVEREIAGSASHTYQLTLAAGQFMRIIVEQKGIDLVLVVLSPVGEQAGEANFTGAGGLESFSHEAAVNGDYRIIVRRNIAPTAPNAVRPPNGAYQVWLDVKAAATEQDRRRIAAERLLAEPINLNRQGEADIQQIVEKAQQALTLWRELADQYWEATTLYRISRLYYGTFKHDRAIEYANQALAIRREIKDRAGEGTTLNGLALIYTSLRRHEKAIECYEQALSINRQLKDRAGEGNTLANLGSAYNRLSRYEKAIEYFEQALAIHREVKNRAGVGNTIGGMNGAYIELGRSEEVIKYYEQAIEFYEQEIAIHRKMKDWAAEADALVALSNIYSGLKRVEKVAECLEQALAIYREAKDRSRELGILELLAGFCYFQGQFERAIEYCEQALAIHGELKNPVNKAALLFRLGDNYVMLKRSEKALEYFEQALAITREIRNRVGEALALSSVGKAYYHLSLYEKAIGYLEQALTIYREMKDRRSIGETLSYIGDVYSALSRYEKAIEPYGRRAGYVRKGEVQTRS